MVVRGRLWQLSNPNVSETDRKLLLAALMDARRAVRDSGTDSDVQALAHARVNAAKIALGERGPTWWDNGKPDYNKYFVKNTPYRSWFEGMSSNSNDLRSPTINQ